VVAQRCAIRVQGGDVALDQPAEALVDIDGHAEGAGALEHDEAVQGAE
jgi:hypothetical protein